MLPATAKDIAVPMLPATAALPAVPIEPATPALAAVAADPATAALATVAAQPTTAVLATVRTEPMSMVVVMWSIVTVGSRSGSPGVVLGSNLSSQESDAMTPKKILGGAVAVGCCIAGAAPAAAGPDPYGGLHCSCRGNGPTGGGDPTQEIQRGLHEGLTAVLPGLSPPRPADPPP